MIDVASLAATGLAFFVVAVSPGPATLSNATVAMDRGRRASLVYGLGLSSGLVVWGLVAASGMGAVLESSLYLLPALKIVGGVYLLWLALVSGRAARRPGRRDAAIAPPTSGWFLRGLALNLSNPKTVIAWTAALAIGLGPEDGPAAVAAATCLCIVVGFAVNALYSLAFSVAPARRVYERARRWIDGIAGALFALAGVGLVRSAFAR